MSISVYRLKQEHDVNLSRRQALVLVNHWPTTSDESTDFVQINQDSLQEDLEDAAECDGTCGCVEHLGDRSPNIKRDHDDVVVELGELLPQFLRKSAADGQHGWVTIQVNW